MTLRLIITATPGSGTTYIARTLSMAGLSCGHEKVFNQSVAINERPFRPRCPAESSAFAVPFLPIQDVVVLHQVRNPIQWLPAILYAVKRINNDRSHRRYRFFRKCASYVTEMNPVLACMRFWIDWNTRIDEHSTLFYRIESLDAPLLHAIVTMGGGEAKGIQWALKKVPSNVNSKKKGPVIPPGKLPRGEITDSFLGLGRQYGYDF